MSKAFGEFVQELGITATARYLGKEEHMRRYAVTLQAGNRRFEVPSYSCGEGIVWNWAQRVDARSKHPVYIGGERITRASQLKGCRLNTIAAQTFLKVIAERYVPSVEDVLQCLALDAQGVQHSDTFEQWAAEFGFDEDSRKAEKIYQACQETAFGLQHWLGLARYQELLECTEDGE